MDGGDGQLRVVPHQQLTGYTGWVTSLVAVAVAVAADPGWPDTPGARPPAPCSPPPTGSTGRCRCGIRCAPDREHLLARAFVELADTLVDDYDVIDVLDRLVAHSVTLLTAHAAGIMLVDPRGRLRVVAFSSEESDWMELLQVQADQGPCVDCVRTRQPVTVTDLDTAATRWPQLVAALAGRGIYRSVHALPLRLRGQAIGGMNLFHIQPGPLPAADLLLGQTLADIATIGILQERAVRRGEIVTEQLQAALNVRVVIEQAKGVLAQRGNLTMHAAFDRLRRHARSHNLLLAEVARRVVTEHDFARQVLAVQVR